MMNRRTTVCALGCLICLGLFNAPRLVASDALEKLDVPVFYDEDEDYGLAIIEYKSTTSAKLIKGDGRAYEVEFDAFILAPEKADVIGFRSEMLARSAKDDRRKELLIPDRKRKADEYVAVLAHPDYTDRRRDPLMLAKIELPTAELKRPGYEVDELEVEAYAVVVEDRESEEIDAIVDDQFVDLGNDMRVRVTAIEIKGRKGVMSIKLDVKRKAGDRGAVIDSILIAKSFRDRRSTLVCRPPLPRSPRTLSASQCPNSWRFSITAGRSWIEVRHLIRSEWTFLPCRFLRLRCPRVKYCRS